jgi:hypothetical protein
MFVVLVVTVSGWRFSLGVAGWRGDSLWLTLCG